MRILAQEKTRMRMRISDTCLFPIHAFPLPLFLLFLYPVFHLSSSLAAVPLPVLCPSCPFLYLPSPTLLYTKLLPPLPSIPLHLLSRSRPSPHPLYVLPVPSYACLLLPSTLKSYLFFFFLFSPLRGSLFLS